MLGATLGPRRAVHDPPPPPDHRFIAATERTLLAWLRTALGLLGLGFAIARAGALLHGPEAVAAGSRRLGVLISALAPVTLLIGAYRYRRAHRALVDGRPPPTETGGPIALVFALAAVSVGMVVHLLFSE